MTDLDRFQKLLEIAEAVYSESTVTTKREKARSSAWVKELRGLAVGATAASVRSLQRDFLVEWNESVGPDVEAFWQRVAAAGISLPRKDVVADTLANGKIASMDVFVALEDHFELLQECGKISAEEADRLNQLLDAFQDAPQNQMYFESEVADESASLEAKFIEPPVQLACGQFVRVADQLYIYDYWGMELYEDLAAMGYQGGGPSWAGIVHGLLTLKAPEVLSQVLLDDSSDYLSAQATDPAPLHIIDSLIADAIASRSLLDSAITVAEADSRME